MIPAPRDGRPRPADDPAAVAVAARRALLLAARLSEAGRAVRGVVPAAGWRGHAATAAREEVNALGTLLDRLPSLLGAVATALSGYAAAVEQATAAVDRLDHAYADAWARHARALAVADAAAVGLPAPVRQRMVADVLDAQQVELRGLDARRVAALEDLSRVATLTGRRLAAAAASVLPARRSAPGRPSAPGAHGQGRSSGPVTPREAALVALLPMLAAQRGRSVTAGVPGRVPAAATPAGLVSSWWGLLTSDERTRLLLAHPAAVGRLTGVPAAVRDAANRRVLARDLLAGLLPGPGCQGSGRSPGDVAARRRAAEVVATALGGAQAATGRTAGRPVAVRLLGFSPDAFGGAGRVLVAVGDPDTADNVAYLVPGMGSNLLHSTAALVGDATRLTVAAGQLAPGESTATIGWLGYDAPGLLGVSSEAAAAAGGARLARDLVATASRPVAPHLTVVGHSYGSTAVGSALRSAPTGVDDVVLLGSPGAGVGRAASLHVPAGHVFVGSSSRDPVSYLDRFGLDPSHERFGAVRFQAEDPTRNPSRLDLADHSKYLRPGTESLGNVSRVVVGDGDEVGRAPYRRELRLRPDGISADPEADRTPAPAVPGDRMGSW